MASPVFVSLSGFARGVRNGYDQWQKFVPGGPSLQLKLFEPAIEHAIGERERCGEQPQHSLALGHEPTRSPKKCHRIGPVLVEAHLIREIEAPTTMCKTRLHHTGDRDKVAVKHAGCNREALIEVLSKRIIRRQNVRARCAPFERLVAM